MVFKPGVGSVFGVKQVATIEDDWHVHQLASLFEVGIGKIFPLRGDDEYFRIAKALVHVLANDDARALQFGSSRPAGLRIVGRHDGLLLRQALAELDGYGFTHVIGVLLEGKTPDGDFFLAEDPQFFANAVEKTLQLGFVDAFDLFQQVERHSEGTADVDEAFDVFREARTAVAEPGIQEMRGDAFVHPYAAGYKANIRSAALADGGDGIDVGDF